MKISFGTLLCRKRNDLCLTVDEMAKRTGYSVKRIILMESGKHFRLTYRDVKRIYKAYEVEDLNASKELIAKLPTASQA